MILDFARDPDDIIKAGNRDIYVFDINGKNIDQEVVQGFGEEWTKFNEFSEQDIQLAGSKYFDIIDENMVNKHTYGIDIGCGTGRWSKFLSQRAGFIEAVDPSNAIFGAAKVLANVDNVRLVKASVDTLPFNDNTFDFGMSVGVLHHIPDTQQAMKDCVKKIKPGGFFYTYLYYNLENRGWFFAILFKLGNVLRKIVCKLPPKLKRSVCDFLAVILYLPFVSLARLFNFFGMQKIALRIPLNDYADKSFFILRNDALDRFGTALEQRFSKTEVIALMQNAGLSNITVSENVPFYHSVGQKI
ncbi:MAG: class I SAM-dependent methyltransferase [Ginsengibacter sp.]